MELKTIPVELPRDSNIIAGQTHFIKTVEDLYEILSGSVPNIKFGIAFCEASQERLVRWDGNDEELTTAAIEAARAVGAGHFFVIFIRNAFPINVLGAIKVCPEVCSIFCATANPVQFIIAESGEQRGVVGVMDGMIPKGVENAENKKVRKDFLRKIGYKVPL